MADFIRLTCPNGHAMKAPDTAHGKRMRCAVCRAVALVPDQNEETSGEPTESRKAMPHANGETQSRATRSKGVLYPLSLGLAVLVAIGSTFWAVRNHHLANQVSTELVVKDTALTTATKDAEASKHAHSVALLKNGLLEKTIVEDKATKDKLERDIATSKQILDDIGKQLKAADVVNAELKKANQNSGPIHNLRGAIYEAVQRQIESKPSASATAKEKDWQTLLIGTWTTAPATETRQIWGAHSFYSDRKYTEAIFETINGEEKLIIFDLKYDVPIPRTKGISINGKLAFTVESISELDMDTSGKLGKQKWIRISHDPKFVITRHSLFKKWHGAFLRETTRTQLESPGLALRLLAREVTFASTAGQSDSQIMPAFPVRNLIPMCRPSFHFNTSP